MREESYYEQARQQLIEDGYCLIDGDLPEGKLQELIAWSDRWLESTDHPERWKYQGSDIYVSGIRNPHKRNPGLPQDNDADFLIEHPKPLLNAMGLGDFKSQNIFQIISKPARAPALYWHQDWARWDDPISMSPWPQQVFLNWYLTETTRNNGCIRVIPGSHRRRLDLHSHLINAHEGGGYEVEETNEWMFCDHHEAMDLPVKPGQLMIGDARLLHSTHPNQSDERRTVLLGWYFRKANDAPPYWHGDIPHEILNRDSDFPMRFNRTPGEYLRA